MSQADENGSFSSLEPSGKEEPCISLIGMPGSGKTTLARQLGSILAWPWLDTDNLLQAWFGVSLEALKEHLGREKFLDCEERMVLDLWVTRCVVATGGSVVYSSRAMGKLRSLGPVVYLRVDQEAISRRVERNPQRGLILKQGQTLGDIFRERSPLYESHADLILDSASDSPEECARLLAQKMEHFL